MRDTALHSTLAVLALVVLAGCVGPVAGPSGGTGAAGTETTERPTTVTPTQTASPTPTATAYPDELVRFPPGPKSRPTLPETLTEERVREYVVTHEYRYSYNEIYRGPETEVGMSESSCHVESTDPSGDGYLVTVECVAYANQPSGGNSTVTVHYDYAPWTVRYYVDADSVLREEIDG